MTTTSSTNNVSIQAALADAERKLLEHSDSAKLDAQVLLAFVLKKELSYFLTWPERTIDAVSYQTFQQLIKQRVAGEPVAYLIGEKEFWSLNLNVAPSTLIPRPDTETLVELVLERHADVLLQHDKNTISCLDLGTGTGAIALALASEQSTWLIDAIDFNDEAVALAKENAIKHDLHQVNIYQSHWFDNIVSDKRFDIIVSNPPYIDETDHHLNEGDVRFEPNSALIAKDHGYEDLFSIIVQAKTYFTAHGYLYLEHGFEQASTIRCFLKEQGYVGIDTKQDLSGNDRVTYAEFIR